MDVSIFTKEIVAVGVLDNFKSLIWVDRYCGFGDCEILVPLNSKILRYLNKDYYLTLKESEHTMILERREAHPSQESEKLVKIKGRSLESILERRHVWNKTILTGNFQLAIHQLLNENAIAPSNEKRRITRLEFVNSDNALFDSLTIDEQIPAGDGLYDTITNLCRSIGVGYKIVLTSTGTFRFSLYAGKDRSEAQNANPHLVFSPKFENFGDSDYIETDEFLKTDALVAGEQGIGNERLLISVSSPSGEQSDLFRREMFVDAADVSRNLPDGGTLTEEEYLAKLNQKGKDELAKNISILSFEGEIVSTKQHIYGVDFFMGDIVQVEDEYGHEGRSQVVELINSQDPAGIKRYPTFVKVA